MISSQHAYEVRPRKDHRGVDLISDALPFRSSRNLFDRRMTNDFRHVGFHFLDAEWFGTILAMQPFAARSPRKIKNLPPPLLHLPLILEGEPPEIGRKSSAYYDVRSRC